MVPRTCISLGAATLPGVAWAHPGHIADLGHGHDHWTIYWLAAVAMLALAFWAGPKIVAWRKAEKRDRR